MNRGSVKYQVNTIINEVREIGQSKFEAQQGFSNSHEFSINSGIYSYNTLDTCFTEWSAAFAFLREAGIRDIENIKPEDLSKYLEAKIDGSDISLKTAQNLCSILAKLGAAIDRYNGTTGTAEAIYQKLREVVADHRAELRDGSGRSAYTDPKSLIENITNDKAQITAQIAYEVGLRANEANKINIREEMKAEDKHKIGLYADNTLIYRGKNGKYGEKTLSNELAQRIRGASEKGTFYCNKDVARKEIKAAAEKTGQYEKGRGLHSLRHSYAIESYHKHISAGVAEKEALKATSEELLHHRAEITKHYLK